MTFLKKRLSLVVGLSALLLYVYFAKQANSDPKGYEIPPLKFLFPAYATQLLSFGDPYLATNINYSRVVTLFHYSNDNVDPRAKLLVQSTDLNAKHLDSMYQLAVLPWEGKVDSSLIGLQKVIEARDWDWRPPFMYGVTVTNFKKDHTLAASYIDLASDRAQQEQRRDYLKTLAAGVATKGNDIDVSLNYIEALIGSVKQQRLKEALEARATRLRTLKLLREAAAKYEAIYGKPLSSLDDLITTGVLKERPELGSGKGFDIDENGRPDFYERIHASTQR